MRRRVRAPRGLTLLELVVAVAVLAIGTLAVLRATDQSGRALGGTEARLLAQLVAENRAEELRLYGSARGSTLPGRVAMGGRDFTVTVDFAQTAANLTQARITARATSGEGALLLAILPAPGTGQ